MLKKEFDNSTFQNLDGWQKSLGVPAASTEDLLDLFLV
jgi:hypothetical protein